MTRVGDVGDLTTARRLAAECLLAGDYLNAGGWFLECAAICIRRGEQDIIVADVIDAMQRYLEDCSHVQLAEDRALLQSFVNHYDELALGVSA